MRITGSDIQRIIEDEWRIQAAAHRRRDEMLRIKGRDLRKLVRGALIREGATDDEMMGPFGEMPPSEDEMVAEIWGAALFDNDQRAFEDLADMMQRLLPSGMLTLSMAPYEAPDGGMLDDIFVIKIGNRYRWNFLVAVGSPEDPDALETPFAEDAVKAAVLAGQMQLGIQEDPGPPADEDDPGVEDDIRRDEMMFGEIYEGRTLRQMIRKALLREGAFPEEIEAVYGEAPPEHMDEDETEGSLALVSGALEGDPTAMGELAASFMEMMPGDMMKFDTEILVPGAAPVYITRSSADTWVISSGGPDFESEESREYTDPEDAADGVISAVRFALMGDEEPLEVAEWEPEEEEGEAFDPMADWMEDERRSMRGEDY